MDCMNKGFAVLVLMMWSSVDALSTGIEMSIPAQGMPTMRSEVRRHSDLGAPWSSSVLQDPDDSDLHLPHDDPKRQKKFNDDVSTESGLSESDADVDLSGRNGQNDGEASANDGDAAPVDGSSEFEAAGTKEGIPKDEALEAQIKKLNEADVKEEIDEETRKTPPKEESEAEIKKQEQQDMADVNEEMAAEASGKPWKPKKASAEGESASFASDDDISDSSESKDPMEKMVKATFQDHLQDEKAFEAATKSNLHDGSEADDSDFVKEPTLDVSLSERDRITEGERDRSKAADQAEAKEQASADALYASALQKEMAENANPGSDEQEAARVQKEVEQKRLASLRDLEGRDNGLDGSVSASLVGGVEQSGVKDSIFDDK